MISLRKWLWISQVITKKWHWIKKFWVIILWQSNMSMVFWHKLSLPWYSFSLVRMKKKSIHTICYTNIHIQACVTLDFSGDDKLCFVVNKKPAMHIYVIPHIQRICQGEKHQKPLEYVRRGIQNGPLWQWLNTHLCLFLTFTFIEWVHTFKSSLPQGIKHTKQLLALRIFLLT